MQIAPELKCVGVVMWSRYDVCFPSANPGSTGCQPAKGRIRCGEPVTFGSLPTTLRKQN